MAISTRLLHRIRQMIADAHSAFIINYISPSAVPPDTLERLRRLGMVRPRIQSIRQAYLLGRLIQVAQAEKQARQTGAPPPAATSAGLRVGGKPGPGVSTPVLKDSQNRQITLASLQDSLRRDPIPLTAAEANALDLHATQTAQYIVGLGNRIEQQTGNMLIEADRKLDAAYRATVQDAVQRNIARRETVQRLKSDLGHAGGDWARDLDRISVSEKQTALQQGYLASVQAQSGTEARIFRLVAPSACSTCRRLYVGEDGNPRVFTVEEVAKNGLTNFGKKQAEYLPVQGATHPACACSWVELPPRAMPLANGRFVYESNPQRKSLTPLLTLKKSFKNTSGT